MKRLLFLGVAFGLVAQVAMADGTLHTPIKMVDDEGAGERIESAEHLRTYTQEAAAAACFYHNGIAVELSREMLVEAHDGFSLHINALLYGNEELGIIGAEERRKTIKEIGEVNAHWEVVSQAIEQLLENSDNAQAFETIAAHNISLLEETDHLLSVIEGEYANPVQIVQSEILALELIGRQAVLSQKIIKYACKIWTGHGTDDVVQKMRDDINLYEMTSGALLHGMPQLSLQPAPDETTADIISKINKDWQKIKPSIVAAANKDDISQEQQEYLFAHMEEEMHLWEKLGHAYVKAVKHSF